MTHVELPSGSWKSIILSLFSISTLHMTTCMLRLSNRKGRSDKYSNPQPNFSIVAILCYAIFYCEIIARSYYLCRCCLSSYYYCLFLQWKLMCFSLLDLPYSRYVVVWNCIYIVSWHTRFWITFFTLFTLGSRQGVDDDR